MAGTAGTEIDISADIRLQLGRDNLWGGNMPLVLEQFVQSLEASGLMSADEIRDFLDSLADSEKPKSGGDLAKTLYRKGRLTKFQAEAVYRGKSKGLVLGEYVVVDRIGAGGMGEVYQAEHRRMKRRVAVKVLPHELTKTPNAVQRFEREVEAAAKLIHPNVVTAFDAGEAAGVHFLVMEFVRGQDLAEIVQQRGPLDVATAIDYTLQAARGLEYAHDQGVVHRDIKPSNLLIDEKGTVKILDMGLARFVNDVAGDEPTAAGGLTQSGQVMGTVDYMSPEQAANTKSADKPADIYSLGATLYYLLTGQSMFGGETLVERIMAHRDQPIPSLRSTRNDVARALDETFRAMVAKTPALRQKSMTQVIEELERCQPAGSVRKPSPSPRAPGGRTTAAETLDLAGKTAALPGTAPTQAAQAPTQNAPAPTRSIQTPRPVQPKRRAAAPERSKKRQSQWDSAVKAADRDYKRRHNIGWFNKIRTVLGKTTGIVVGLTVVILVGTAVYFGATKVWANYSLQSQCRSQLLEVLSPIVEKEGFEPISVLDLKDVSWQNVPDEIAFEAQLMQTTNTGRRPTAKIQGRIKRSTGQVLVGIDRLTGKDIREFPLKVQPVQ